MSAFHRRHEPCEPGSAFEMDRGKLVWLTGIASRESQYPFRIPNASLSHLKLGMRVAPKSRLPSCWQRSA
jgi:hypothetical protein